MSKSSEEAVVTDSASASTSASASRDGVNGSSVDHQGNSPPFGAPGSQADSGYAGNSSTNQSHYYHHHHFQGAAAFESPAFLPVSPSRGKFWAPGAVRIPNAEPFFASPKRSCLTPSSLSLSSQHSSPRLEELRSSTPVTSPQRVRGHSVSTWNQTANSDGPQLAPRLHAQTPSAEEFELLSEEQRQVYQVGEPTSYRQLALREFEEVNERVAEQLLQERQLAAARIQQRNQRIATQIQPEEVRDQKLQVLGEIEQTKELVLQETQPIVARNQDLNEQIVVEIQEIQQIPQEIQQEALVTEISAIEQREEQVVVVVLQEDQNIATEIQDLNEPTILSQIVQETQLIADKILQEDHNIASQIPQEEIEAATEVSSQFEPAKVQPILSENPDINEQIVVEIQEKQNQEEDQKILQANIPIATEVSEFIQNIVAQIPQEDIQIATEVLNEFERAEEQEDPKIATVNQDIQEQIVVEIQDEPNVSHVPQESEQIATEILQEDQLIASPTQEENVPTVTEILQEDHGIVAETQDINEQIVIETEDQPIVSQIPLQILSDLEPTEEQVAVQFPQEDQDIATEIQDISERLVVEIQNEPIVPQVAEEKQPSLQETQLIASPIQQEDQEILQADIPIVTEQIQIETEVKVQNHQVLNDLEQAEEQKEPKIVAENQDIHEQTVIEIQDEPIVSHDPQSLIQQEDIPTVTEEDRNIVTETQDLNEQIVIEIEDEPIVSQLPQENHLSASESQDQNTPILEEFKQAEDQVAAQIPEEAIQIVTEIQSISNELQQEDEQLTVQEEVEEEIQFVTEVQDHSQSILVLEEEDNDQIAPGILQETQIIAAQLQPEDVQIVAEIEVHNDQILREFEQKEGYNNQKEDIKIAAEIQEQNHQILREFQQEEDQTAAHIQQNSQEIVTDPHNHIDQSGIEVEDLREDQNQTFFSEFQQEDQQIPVQKEPHFASEVHYFEHKLKSQIESEIQYYQPAIQYYQQDSRIPVGPVEIRYYNQEPFGLLEFENQLYQPDLEELANHTAGQSPAEAGQEQQQLASEAKTQTEQNPESNEATELHPYTECVRKLLELIGEACDSLKAHPEHFQAAGYRLALLQLRQKLANVCHQLVEEAIRGESTKQSVVLLREIFLGIEETELPKQRATGQRDELQNGISMGLEILKRLRQLVTGWYKPKEEESDSGEAETGRNRAADSANSTWKRRHQEENTRPIKYRRVDNSFPRFITNEPAAEDLIPSKSMAERERENQQQQQHQQQQGSKRLSIFNPPVYTQHRVRNEAPYIPNPFDVSDDDEPAQRFANAAGPSARHPQLLYSDAVRLGQNGFVGEARVNGHASRRAPAQAEKSILTHEMERMEHEQYMNLIHTVTHNDSVASRFAKPNPPPLQRIDAQPATWSSMLHNNQSRSLQQHQQQPSSSSSRRPDNRGLSDYARLIRSSSSSSQAERQKPSPAPTPPPQLMRIGSFNNSRASTLSSSSGSSESSNSGSSDSLVMVTAADDGSNERKAANTMTNHTDAAKSPSGQTPSRLAVTDALQRRFASCIYLKDDFVEQFKAKSARIQEETEHRRKLAVVEAKRTTEERRDYEYKLRENIFQYRILHKPIFVIGSVDKPASQPKETKIIPLTKEHIRRYNELMTGEVSTVLVVKFNMHITRRDIRTMLDGEWLNDEVINFYMNLMTERSEKRPGELPATYAMNTFFVPRLLQAGHAGVKRWTRKVDIFSKDVIPVPVHVNGVHWCMAIIHMRNKTIHYYDSMGQPNQPVLNALEAYLREESLDKRKQPFDTSVFKIESAPNVPQQQNGSDCGVFSCMFAEYISRDVPITFCQTEMEYFRRKMVLEIAAGEIWN
ncbi:interaptin isoform X2 [Drosophila takahashii]